MPLLHVSNIVKVLDGKTVLGNLSFELNEGEILVIVGKSGEGKSTLLKIIAGLMDADSGEVKFREKKVSGPSGQLIPGHSEIKLVNQDFALDLYHTVEENIRIKILHHTSEVISEITEELLEVMGLTKLRLQKAHLLSGGEQQRLALARTLANEPDVILLDEPFVHLDPPTRQRIEQYVGEMRNKWRSSIILVTHDGKEAMTWGDRIAFMSGGNIKRMDSAEEFYNNPKSLDEAHFFGEINLIDFEGKTIMFRPNAYTLSEDKGIEINIYRSVFQGTHYVNYGKTRREEDVLLYSALPLEKRVMIRPNYAKK